MDDTRAVVEGLSEDDTQVVVLQNGTRMVHLQNTMDHGTKDAPCTKCRDHDLHDIQSASVPNLKAVDYDAH